ncbi:uncharacterized protein BDR25DRAFT_361735 [Lindgomyces ingoldianus]|uniref:Uncharacterized protein n=1 Tax=Lindgomyces ingoldianus TaxID=673940 RepID=A0ACB6QDN0_9PLEO|nr:uncharacterized protein BDR25DRAFT_361735 [Lindgomyces ingoldianus]KAF2464227.1 hypothetical protein BDR25DRAFT_361735 [Lindgomyces ingoldianus]
MFIKVLLVDGRAGSSTICQKKWQISTLVCETTSFEGHFMRYDDFHARYYEKAISQLRTGVERLTGEIERQRENEHQPKRYAKTYKSCSRSRVISIITTPRIIHSHKNRSNASNERQNASFGNSQNKKCALRPKFKVLKAVNFWGSFENEVVMVRFSIMHSNRPLLIMGRSVLRFSAACKEASLFRGNDDKKWKPLIHGWLVNWRTKVGLQSQFDETLERHSDDGHHPLSPLCWSLYRLVESDARSSCIQLRYIDTVTLIDTPLITLYRSRNLFFFFQHAGSATGLKLIITCFYMQLVTVWERLPGGMCAPPMHQVEIARCVAYLLPGFTTVSGCGLAWTCVWGEAKGLFRVGTSGSSTNIIARFRGWVRYQVTEQSGNWDIFSWMA